MSQWWTQGVTPEGATLNRVADALEVDVAELWRAYQGRYPEGEEHRPGHARVTEPAALDPAILDELERRIRRAFREELEAAIRRVTEGAEQGA